MAKKSSREAAIQDVVEKVLLQRAQEDISAQEQIAFKELKNAANIFLKSINMYSDIFTHQNLVKRMEAVKSLTNLLYGDMRYNSTYTQNILSAQHDFENKLNQFLNRKIYLTHVSESGELISYSDVAVGELYKQATGNVGRGNISEGKIKNIIDTDNDIKIINEELRKSTEKRKKVYEKAISRWKKNTKEEHMNYDSSEKTFYWKSSPSKIAGHTAPIATQGIIAEGYAEAVINNQNDILNTHLENSLKVLWEKYIKKDSIPAAVKGDVILKGTNLQFAIKQGSFSTAKIGQYINLAYNITRLADDTLRQDFYLALPKLVSLSKASNKIIDIMNQKAVDTVYQIVKMNVSNAKVNSEKWKDMLSLMGVE